MRYLTVSDVIRINEAEVGPDALADFGLLESAVLAAIVFYGLNGWDFHAEDGELVALAVDAAEGILDVPAITKALAAMVHARDAPEDEGG